MTTKSEIGHISQITANLGDEKSMKNLLSNLFLLTKPPIMLLVVFSGATALFMKKDFIVTEPLQFFLIILGLYLTGGSANALNQYFERDIDARMSRTKKRRPLPQGKITPNQALIFSLTIGIAGVLIFAIFFNILSSILALGTILFYSLFYTLWLKPNTPQNIVIGGIAGAMPPLIAWAGATASLMAYPPWILFLMIFFWTPAHFWALALFCEDDYKLANLPMMPVVKGEDETLKLIFYYTLITVGVTLTMLATDSAKWLYMLVAVVLGAIFIKKSHETRKHKSKELEKGLFKFSILYLFSLFFAIIIEGFIMDYYPY